jgi:hypothetical protein
MIKHTITDLDIKIAKLINSPPDYAYSSSETYIVRLKKFFEKNQFGYILQFSPLKEVSKRYCVTLVNKSNEAYCVSPWCESEPMALCLAAEQYFDKEVNKKV